MVSASLAVSYRMYRVNSLKIHLLSGTSGLSLATRELVMFIFLNSDKHRFHYVSTNHYNCVCLLGLIENS